MRISKYSTILVSKDTKRSHNTFFEDINIFTICYTKLSIQPNKIGILAIGKFNFTNLRSYCILVVPRVNDLWCTVAYTLW